MPGGREAVEKAAKKLVFLIPPLLLTSGSVTQWLLATLGKLPLVFRLPMEFSS